MSYRTTRVYEVPALPNRPDDSHKGTFKRILVVGGSPEMLGAPVLAGTSALRMGAGLVQVALHRTLLSGALSITPELVGHALDERSDKQLIAQAEKADVLVIGPGMGLSPASKRRLKSLLKLAKPTLVDADAITLLAAEKKPYRHKAPLLLTPHPAEMQRLGKHFGQTTIAQGDNARIALAVQAAHVFSATVILKGARTVVTDGKQVYVCGVSDSSLAKAGTGDVMAGILGTLVAQMPSPFHAAQLAVTLHARSGVIAGERLTKRSVLARDVIDALPQAIKER